MANFTKKSSAVILSPAVEKKINEIADAFFNLTKKKIVITDGSGTAGVTVPMPTLPGVIVMMGAVNEPPLAVQKEIAPVLVAPLVCPTIVANLFSVVLKFELKKAFGPRDKTWTLRCLPLRLNQRRPNLHKRIST